MTNTWPCDIKAVARPDFQKRTALDPTTHALAVEPGAMASTAASPIGIAMATTTGCPQSERIVISSWRRVARRPNRNFCAIINDQAGRKLFFKHNLGGNFKYVVTESERRRRDICNILASRILTEIFSLRSVVYHDSVLFLENGRQIRGVACDYLEKLRWLQAVQPEEVINPQDAICQIVVLTWLGDIDRLKNPGNDFVTQGGMYGTLDFDFCFSEGVSFFGLPIGNRCALKYFTSIGTIDTVISTILKLTDADIAKMVERLGRDWISDWSEEYQSSFLGVLIRNRERLRSSNALRQFGVNMGLPLLLLDHFVTRLYGPLIALRKIKNVITYQGPLETLSELRKQVLLSFNRRNKSNNGDRPPVDLEGLTQCISPSRSN
jgi:hypothetical protein